MSWLKDPLVGLRGGSQIQISVLVLFYLSHWWLNRKESACSAGDLGSIPGLGTIPWRRKWQPTAVFLPGESHGQKSLESCGRWGQKESDTTERQTV